MKKEIKLIALLVALGLAVPGTIAQSAPETTPAPEQPAEGSDGSSTDTGEIIPDPSDPVVDPAPVDETPVAPTQPDIGEEVQLPEEGSDNTDNAESTDGQPEETPVDSENAAVDPVPVDETPVDPTLPENGEEVQLPEEGSTNTDNAESGQPEETPVDSENLVVDPVPVDETPVDPTLPENGEVVQLPDTDGSSEEAGMPEIDLPERPEIPESSNDISELIGDFEEARSAFIDATDQRDDVREEIQEDRDAFLDAILALQAEMQTRIAALQEELSSHREALQDSKDDIVEDATERDGLED